jgi:hypothetical protein
MEGCSAGMDLLYQCHESLNVSKKGVMTVQLDNDDMPAPVYCVPEMLLECKMHARIRRRASCKK